MQFDRLKLRKFIHLHCGAESPSRLLSSAAPGHAAAGVPHRRELLQSLLAAALANAAGWPNDPVAASMPLERDRFVELSAKLCAMSIEDGSLADAIQTA